VVASSRLSATVVANNNESLWRNRDFVLLSGGLAASMLGSRITATAYPLLVLALTGSAAHAGLVGFLAMLPHLLFQLPGGVLVDRWHRRTVMLVTDAGRAVAIGSLVAGLALGELTIAWIGAVAFVEGALSVFFQLAEQGAVRSVVPRAQLTAALATNEARYRSAGLLGRPLGGVFFDVGRAVPFVVDALSYVMSFAAVALIRTPLQEAREARTARFVVEALEGVRWLMGQPFLRATTLAVAGTNFLWQGITLTVIVLLTENGESATTVGLVLGGIGLGGVLGSVLAPRVQRRLPPQTVVVWANWIWAAGVPMLALDPPPYLMAPLLVAMGIVGPLWNVVVVSYRLSIIPDNLIARVQGASMLVAWGTIPLGSLAAGLLLEAFGPVATLLVFAALMIVVAAGLHAAPSVRDAPRLPEAS
jgi:MFS family permease